MSSFQKSIHRIKALEELAYKNTILHRMKASVKLILTFLFIIIVVSYHPLQVSELLMLASFPVFFMIIGEIPLKALAIRCLMVLPFVFFAGISNLIFDRSIYTILGGIIITKGMVTFASLILKTILTVMTVLILIATTKMNDLIYALYSLRVPSIIIIQIMMTYRYMSVLIKETSLMYHAYLLRAPKEKGIKLKDMGNFLGQLILRSIDRAERIYQAMQCRGFHGKYHFSEREVIGGKGWIIIIVTGSLLISLRLIHQYI